MRGRRSGLRQPRIRRENRGHRFERDLRPLPRVERREIINSARQRTLRRGFLESPAARRARLIQRRKIIKSTLSMPFVRENRLQHSIEFIAKDIYRNYRHLPRFRRVQLFVHRVKRVIDLLQLAPRHLNEVTTNIPPAELEAAFNLDPPPLNGDSRAWGDWLRRESPWQERLALPSLQQHVEAQRRNNPEPSRAGAGEVGYSSDLGSSDDDGEESNDSNSNASDGSRSLGEEDSETDSSFYSVD